jgi:predicted nucleic acid-binding protein
MTGDKVFLDTNIVIYAAITGGATLLLSEDLSHGQIVNDVKINNPFNV